MGHNIRECEMVGVKEEIQAEYKDDKNKDDALNLLSNMVDARACYKPSERVRYLQIKTHINQSKFLS